MRPRRTKAPRTTSSWSMGCAKIQGLDAICWVLSMCASVYVCMYACMYTQICWVLSMCVSMYVCMYVCMYVYRTADMLGFVKVCVYVCMYECMYTQICWVLSMCVFMYVSICVCMYVCMHVHVCTPMYTVTKSQGKEETRGCCS